MLRLLLIIIGILSSFQLAAQDDLMAMLEKEDAKQTNYTLATFKASRLINGQTVETIAKKHLNFWISHRFGAVNSGFIDNFLGLDEARIRLGLEYALTDNLLIGAGRSTIEKTYDTYAKYKIIRQSNKIPVTITAYGSVASNTMKTGYTMESGTVMRFNNNLQRQTFMGQLLIVNSLISFRCKSCLLFSITIWLRVFIWKTTRRRWDLVVDIRLVIDSVFQLNTIII